MVSVEAIEALEADGYFEYTLWKARVSGFWNSRWLAYPISTGIPESHADGQIADSDATNAKERALEERTGGPVMESFETALYFNKMSLGLWSICLDDATMSKTEGAVWY